MSKSNNPTYRIEISLEDLRKRLKSLIKSENSELISTVIVNNLNTTEVGIDRLFNALSGIDFEPVFNIGDTLWVKFDDLYTWKLSRTFMEEAGLIEKGMVKVKILSISSVVNAPYYCVYQAKNTKGDSIMEHQSFKANQLAYIESIPGKISFRVNL